jgi:hypothetical protein
LKTAAEPTCPCCRTPVMEEKTHTGVEDSDEEPGLEDGESSEEL